MYLPYFRAFFALCICDLCWGYRLYEDRAEFVTEGEGLNISETESTNSLENAWKILLTDEPSVFVVDAREVLLEKVKLFLMKDNETCPGSGKPTLATFDSTGLQDVISFDNNRTFCQAILGLSPKSSDNEISSPIMHALLELLKRNASRGSLVLVTMTKPSDQDFTNDVINTLLNKKCQLSVLWMGTHTTNDTLPLRTITERTGGKFISTVDDKESFIPRSNFEDLRNFSHKIRFPERSAENEDGEMHLTSRAASDQRVSQKAVVPLIVEVASGSSLEMRPGSSTQIQFTVKNNINIGVTAIFSSKFNGMIQNVQPHQALLPPGGTATVIVNLQPIGASQSGSAIGTLTLFAQAANWVTARSALISMTPQNIKDNTAPKMYYKYDGDCSNYKEPQNCKKGQWNLEVTFQDEDSGLLKILSEPYGLLFHSEFIAGSKTPVTASYSATCCQPIVHIWSEDLKGNYVKKSFDVFNQNLLAGEIASIVLGVLLLLLIIIVIIVVFVLIKRRNQRNLIIPRTRSGSR